MAANLYKVYYSKKKKTPYRMNGVFRVLTNGGVVRAATLCEEAYPGCTVWNVVHSGTVDVYDPGLGIAEPRSE